MADDPRDLPPGNPRGEPITFDFEGRSVRAYAGEPVAVALWADGVTTLARSAKYHRPRGVFCLEGHCIGCTMRIDGKPNMRACMAPARAGLRGERQNAFPSADLDVLRAADWMFPGGMDHHTLMTGTRLGNRVLVDVVRRMGGAGTLPDRPAAVLPEIRDEACDVCVVGAGPAGLAAARAVAAARPGARVLLFDEQDAPGGSLLAEPDGVARGAALAAAAAKAGAVLSLSSPALSFYPEDHGGVLAVVTPGGLWRVSARRFVYATGGYDQNLAFADNDRPGVVSARACGRLAFRFGVRPGRRVVVVAAGSPYATTLAAGLRARGVETEVVDAAHTPIGGALGVKRVRGLRTADGVVPGDVVAVAALPAPASELARGHGAAVIMDEARGGFRVEIDARFETSAPGVHACGDVTGHLGPAAAEAAGEAAGRAVAESLG